MSTRKKLSLGVIGTGEIVSYCKTFLTSNPDMEVSAIADVNPHAIEQTMHALGTNVLSYSDYHAILENPRIDAVYIATPPFLHKKMVCDSILAGKHVLCEKPFTLNRHEADEIHRLAQSHSHLKIACCSSRFLTGAPVEAARAALPLLGTLYSVRHERVSHVPSPSSSTKAWKRDKSKCGGGLLMDWGVYELDHICHILGDEFRPIRIFATMENHWNPEGLETGYSLLIHCDKGLTVTLDRRSEIAPLHQIVQIRGTQGSIDLPFEPPKPPQDPTQGAILHSISESGVIHSRNISPPLPESSWENILNYPLANFTHAIQTDMKIASDTKRQLLIHVIMDAAYESAVHAKVIDIHYE